MAFIDTIFDWDGTNFKKGMDEIYVTKLKDIFDKIVEVVDNGN